MHCTSCTAVAQITVNKPELTGQSQQLPGAPERFFEVYSITRFVHVSEYATIYNRWINITPKYPNLKKLQHFVFLVVLCYVVSNLQHTGTKHWTNLEYGKCPISETTFVDFLSHFPFTCGTVTRSVFVINQ